VSSSLEEEEVKGELPNKALKSGLGFGIVG
jgi:hypothetical protein